MNRKTIRTLLRSSLLAVALLVAGLALGSSSASAQCPDYWVNLNYLVPAPHPGPVSIDLYRANGTVITNSFSNDGHFTFPQSPVCGPLAGVMINGTMVMPGQRIKLPYPGLPPGMCIETEVRFDSKGCIEIKMQPQGC